MSDKIYTVERVVDVRKNKRGRQEVLVKWFGYDHSNNTWEPRVNISKEVMDSYFKMKKCQEEAMAIYEKNKDEIMERKRLWKQKMEEKRARWAEEDAIAAGADVADADDTEEYEEYSVVADEDFDETEDDFDEAGYEIEEDADDFDEVEVHSVEADDLSDEAEVVYDEAEDLSDEAEDDFDEAEVHSVEVEDLSDEPDFFSDEAEDDFDEAEVHSVEADGFPDENEYDPHGSNRM